MLHRMTEIDTHGLGEEFVTKYLAKVEERFECDIDIALCLELEMPPMGFNPQQDVELAIYMSGIYTFDELEANLAKYAS